MRTLLLFFLAAICCSAGNLVNNPDFEGAVEKDGLPGGGWWLYQGMGETRVAVDRKTAHQGRASVRMESSGEEKCVLVCRKIEVAPGDGLQFETWVRGTNLPASRPATYAGLVFRDADGKIVQRHYVTSGAVTAEWSRISAAVVAPEEAATAEVHLGYTNWPGTVWYDDVSAVITNALSLSLVDGAKSWPGSQEIALRVANRESIPFHGSIEAQAGKKTETVPVALAPNSSGIFKVPITLAGVGLHPYKISLLDERGAVVRTIQGKFKTSPALVLFPACPCFLPRGEGKGDVLIDARVNLDPAHRAGLMLIAAIAGPDGAEAQNLEAPVSKGELTELRASLPVSAAGAFNITARIVDSAGSDIASAQGDVHIIAPDEARVQLGADGYLRVAGQPEFPIGLYSSSRDAELAKAGFNATHNYNVSTGDTSEPINPTDPQLKELLDQAWASGMRMMVELPRKAIEQGKWEQVRRRIETFRHHPGLLCWGSEERVARGLTTPAHIAALYALVKKMDPDHPLVLGDTRAAIEKLQVDRRDFFPDASMDIGIWWWYPFPMKAGKADALDGTEGSGNYMESPTWLTTTHSKKPLWIAIQAYQKPSRDARFPTPAEYRCETWLSIIYGVKGLWFYCGSGQKDYLGKPSGILNKPELGHWDYVKQLAGELRDLSPVIMAPPASEKIILTTKDAPVAFTTRSLDGKIYLIAANKSGLPQKARWQGESLRGRKAAALFEEHAVKIEGDELADDFSPYGVHIYKLE